eukprot:Opistho-2@38011
MDLTPDLRPMGLADVPAVLRLQAQCYGPAYLERAEAFEAKLRAVEPLQTSWLAWRGDEPLAYAVGLPVDGQSFPALDAPEFSLASRPELLYLHDLAVAPAGRGQGLAQRLLARLRASAQALGLVQMGLIAVQGSVPFWQAQGFAVPARLDPALADKLASFGAEARFMSLRLA